MIKCLRLIAEELHAVRANAPTTIGEALPAYASALDRARRRGAEPAALLVIGELLWMSLRPEKEPVPDEIGGWLDRLWLRYASTASTPGTTEDKHDCG